MAANPTPPSFGGASEPSSGSRGGSTESVISITLPLPGRTVSHRPVLLHYRSGVVALFARFLRFGLLAWGGPVAQIAMLRKELVEEEQWVSGERFNRLLAVYQVLPGPEATELAVHLGMTQRGRLGGILAGVGFMLPGFVLALLLASLYVSIDMQQPALAAALLGIQVAVVALILRATVGIGRHIVTDRWTGFIAVGAGVMTLAGVSFWLVLPMGGAAYVLAGRLSAEGARARIAWAAMAALAVGAAALWWAAVQAGISDRETGGSWMVPWSPTQPTLLAIFATGLKAGLLTFGGAYTAIPFVRSDAVGGNWITDGQFLDSVALSGILPAPLIIFGTFVGYLAGGLPGAVLMTLAIFLPAFSFAVVLGDRIEAVVEHPGLYRFLEGVPAGVVGIIAVTAFELAIDLALRLPNLGGAVIVVAALVVLARWRSRAATPAVIIGAAVAGLLLFETALR